MMKGIIYRIVNNQTDDIYVGSTIQSMKHRFKTHRSNANINKPGRLYECMREHGIMNFQIELIEELNIGHPYELGEKEEHYYNLLNPTLNMRSPIMKNRREIGRIYNLYWNEDQSYFYIGSTLKYLTQRLSDHRSASMKGTTPIYRFMREKGRDNFSITCIEDNVPVSNLIQREDYWIKQMNPTLNKNLNLTITEQERDRLKYLKNREKRLKQVNDRRLAKYDEIREQKRQHFHEQQTQLENAVIIPYDTNPCFTQDILQKYNLLNLKIIAKRFNLTYSHRKDDLIEHILQEQSRIFPA